MKKYLILLFSLVILTGIGIYIYIKYSESPVLVLNGKEKVEINYNESYKDEGAKARLNKKDISKKIRVEGTVDTKKIGTYTLTYTAKNHKKAVKKTRIIKVVDTKKPEIKLNGANELTVYLNDTYKEPGVTAIDEYDKDLTKNVKIDGKVDTKNVGTYTLTYKVSDSSGNEASITRKVNVKKKAVSQTNQMVPVLMYHYFYDAKKGETGKNSNYMEIHDFENQVKYLKESNFYFPTYQELLDFVNKKISLPDKSVIITIDDGQSSFFSEAVSIINKYNVKVTSFIIGKNGDKFKKYLSNNITYQSHTYNMHRGGCSGGHGGIFQCINYNDGLSDLKKSIEQLGSSDALAYPYGDINANTKKITKAAGFKVAFTTKYGYVKPGMDPLELPRVRMSKGISLASFKKIVG